MQKTNISWSDFSSNPLKYRRKSDGAVVWGCVMTSPGCANCYSQATALHYDRGKLYNAKNMEELEPFLDEAELRQLLARKTCGGKQVSGSRVFCFDMTDLFGDWVADELIDRVFAVMALRPDVTFQILTKRAERMWAWFSEKYQSPNFQIVNGKPTIGEPTGELNEDREDRVKQEALGIILETKGDVDRFYDEAGNSHVVKATWPLPNVWLGVSAENQQCADERLPHLLRTPAAVRFVSYEPCLGPVDFCHYLESDLDRYCRDDRFGIPVGASKAKLSWLIAGAESGPHYRPCEVEWITDAARQCQAAGVACFVKQDSSLRPGQQGRIPDGIWALKQFPGVTP